MALVEPLSAAKRVDGRAQLRGGQRIERVGDLAHRLDGDVFRLHDPRGGILPSSAIAPLSRLPGVIIDAHMHVDDIPALGWKMEADLRRGASTRPGIDRGVVMTIVDAPEVNPDAIELVAEALRRLPRPALDAFARIHPWYGDEAVALLERAFELGFKGLKLHPVSTIAHPRGEDTLRLIRIARPHTTRRRSSTAATSR